jgi:hypothetical protein
MPKAINSRAPGNPAHSILPVALTLVIVLTRSALAAPLPITPGPALNPFANLILNGSFEGGSTGNPLTGTYWASGTALTPLEPVTSWTTSGSAANYAYRANTQNASGTPPVPDGQVALYFGNGFASAISETPTFNPDGSLTFVSPTPTITTGVGLSPPVSIRQTVAGLNTGNVYALSFWASGEDAANGNNGHDGIFGLDVTGFSTTFLAAPGGAPGGGVGTQKVYRFEFQPTTTSVTIGFTNWGHFSGAPSVPGSETVGWTIPLNTTELVLDNVILNDLGPAHDVPEPAAIRMLGVVSLMLLWRRKR